jgi:hypothetical protein
VKSYLPRYVGSMWLAEGVVAIYLICAAIWLVLNLLLVLAVIAAVAVLAFLAWCAWLEPRAAYCGRAAWPVPRKRASLAARATGLARAALVRQ